MTSRSAVRQAISERVVPRFDYPILEEECHVLEAPTSDKGVNCIYGLARRF